ncbi:Serine/threonine protein kinase [Kibdelosporangium aridum]|uniref:non-specific serine/threonine protein kinase n=1 Tax=Kibdelosporangium aridum TaxID=2030 RepID=A0A1Y5XNF4_KIBAR|nr:Serine/threonine protein kinase [Kibdelosporangium aridum]
MAYGWGVRSRRLIAGRYRLEEQLGSGGMGVVWRATDEELGRVVAVKRALPVAGAQAKLLKREAKAAARVNHPNVVTLYDVVTSGDEVWLVMEYLPASTLAGQGVLPAGRVAQIGVQLADALTAIHAAGVLHRDVKPSNVLMTNDGRPKLTDFGVSRSVHNDITVSRTGGLDGTPGYLAPEVARGEDATSASDVFSLGATLFAAVEGVSPVGKADNPQVLVWRAARGDIAESHGPLRQVLSALLKPDPRKRPTAAQAKQMLEAVANGIRQRPPILARAAILLVLVATWGLLSYPSESASAASPTVGDPHTVDPCSLLDPGELKRFGNTDLDPDYGNFNRCDVLIRPEEGPGEVDVRLTFELVPKTGEVPPGQIERVGLVQVVRHPIYSDSSCMRSLVMPDKRYAIPITAKFNRTRFPVDLCAVAESAVSTALDRLKGTIPRRVLPPAPDSLINVDACAMPDADILALFPGVDANNPEPAFGDWECRWRSTTSNSTLMVIFDQRDPLNASDGKQTTFAGHPAAVEDNGYGDNTCVSYIQHREYTNDDARPAIEALMVVVFGQQTADGRLCKLVTDISEPLAAKLPG